MIFFACNEDNLPAIEYEDFEVDFCYSYMNDGRYIINDSAEYRTIMETFKLDTLDFPECTDSFFLKKIDFKNKTLLGYRICGSGCETIFNREVLLDEANQKYVYKVLVKEVGACEPLRCDMNWVLIPKIPEGYFVEFL